MGPMGPMGPTFQCTDSFVTSSILAPFVVRPGAPSSVLAPSSVSFFTFHEPFEQEFFFQACDDSEITLKRGDILQLSQDQGLPRHRH